MDPLAEQTFEPYSYTGNNPIMFTDPTGMSKDGVDTHYIDENGHTLADTKDGNNATVIISSQNTETFKKEFENTPLMMQHGELANSRWISNYGEAMIAEEGANV